MTLSKHPSADKPPHDPAAFANAGTALGVVLGVLSAFVTRNWFAWTIGLGVTGLIVGALIDRSRR